MDMTPWLDSVPVVLQTWYPGQEGGTALAEVLFGNVNPSGRLPVTFERQWEDNPVHDNYYPSDNTKRVVYKEGVFVGYRGYEHYGTKPLFPFGYGLSYTMFAYRNLSVARAGNNVAVSFDITNTIEFGPHLGQWPRSSRRTDSPETIQKQNSTVEKNW